MCRTGLGRPGWPAWPPQLSLSPFVGSPVEGNPTRTADPGGRPRWGFQTPLGSEAGLPGAETAPRAHRSLPHREPPVPPP
uniref:Uncharacterized protein n=1 Tax=Ixodes ricinus TaxID=34613 RepID=A0A6B0U5P8_IXORI